MDNNIIKRLNELKAEIEQHNYNYYVMDNPTIDDYTYDMMMQELNKLKLITLNLLIKILRHKG